MTRSPRRYIVFDMTTAVIAVIVVGLIFSYLLRFKPVQNFVVRKMKSRKKPRYVLRGQVGELKINQMLNTLSRSEYTSFHNLYIPSPSNKKRPFSEVDHIVVSRYGVFVIETKSYTGEIDAKREWKNWYYSHDRIGFENPINQNKRHVYDLKKFLSLNSSHLHSLVFFANGNSFKHRLPPNVHNRNFLKPITSRRQPTLGTIQVELINAELTALASPDYRETAAKKHQAHLATK